LIFIICLTACIFTGSLLSGAENDLCEEQGIIVANQSMLDLWYKKNGSECTIWIHEHVLIIKPKETVGIFSDMTCETRYCGDASYGLFKALDRDRDCGVRILPECSLSDM